MELLNQLKSVFLRSLERINLKLADIKTKLNYFTNLFQYLMYEKLDSYSQYHELINSMNFFVLYYLQKIK